MNSSIFQHRQYGAPGTPLSTWKFFTYESRNKNVASSTGSATSRTVVGRKGDRRRSGGKGKFEVSSRKLYSRLWRLRLACGDSGGGGGRGLNLKCRACDGLETEINSSSPCPKATKRNLRLGSKLLEDQINNVFVPSPIKAKLVQAQLRICKLEAEKLFFQKKIKHLVRKVREERTTWQRREYQKIQAVIYDLKEELSRESKNHQSMEILNDLAHVKWAAKQLKKNYEKEKKGREVMEDVCNELENKIAEQKIEAEALKMELIKIWKEMEEERKMLQIAERWREERIHMKLTDAKLALEDKYCQLNRIIMDLEAFLRSRSSTLDAMDLREAEFIRRAAESVNIKDIKEFSYIPLKSNDVYSTFEEIQQIEANERTVETCNRHSPASYVVNHCNKQHLLNHSNGSIASNGPFEEDVREREFKSRAEDHCSYYSLKEHDHFVNATGRGKNAWQSESARECKETGGQDFLNTQMSGVCSLPAEQSLRKISSTCKILGSSTTNRKCSKIKLDYNGNARLSNDVISNLKPTSLKTKFRECRPRLVKRQWSSKGLMNPLVTRGIKGYINGWPRHAPKNSLKAKIERQKTLLRCLLKKKD